MWLFKIYKTENIHRVGGQDDIYSA